jgi:hypothetical protein
MATNNITPVIHLTVRALALALVRTGRAKSHEQAMELAARIIARRAVAAPIEQDAARHLAEVAQILVEQGGRSPATAAADAARVFGPTPTATPGTPITFSARAIARALIRSGLPASIAGLRAVVLADKARAAASATTAPKAPARTGSCQEAGADADDDIPFGCDE